MAFDMSLPKAYRAALMPDSTTAQTLDPGWVQWPARYKPEIGVLLGNLRGPDCAMLFAQPYIGPSRCKGYVCSSSSAVPTLNVMC